MPGHIDMTDAQKQQLKDLHEKHAEAMREQREAMAAMREEYREALSEVLTEEQRAALPLPLWMHGLSEDILHSHHLESIKKSIEHYNRGIRETFAHWGDMHGIKSAFAKLDLTDKQKQQLKERLKMQREEFHKWLQGQRKAMEDILTDEQREKLEMLKDEAFYGDSRW